MASVLRNLFNCSIMARVDFNVGLIKNRGGNRKVKGPPRFEEQLAALVSEIG